MILDCIKFNALQEISTSGLSKAVRRMQPPCRVEVLMILNFSLLLKGTITLQILYNKIQQICANTRAKMHH